MKLTVKQLKSLVREAMEEMAEVDSDLKHMSRNELLSLYSDIIQLSDDDLREKIQNLRIKWGQEASDRYYEFEKMKEPEEGEEFPGHEGMGRRHPLEETLKLVVMEVLAEAKAKKPKGKSAGLTSPPAQKKWPKMTEWPKMAKTKSVKLRKNKKHNIA